MSALAIWHKPRPFGPGQRFVGAERVSQYLPNNSAHQRASRNFTVTEAAREYFRARPHSGRRTTCGPQQKADSVCSRHGPQDIQRLLRGVALAKYSSAVPRVCQRPLAAESPLLSFLPQGQKVFVRTTGASCDVDNVSRLPVEAARKGNQPAQLLAWVSRSSVQVPQQTGDVGLRIRLVEQRKQQGSLGSIDCIDRRDSDTCLACIRSIEAAP